MTEQQPAIAAAVWANLSPYAKRNAVRLLLEGDGLTYGGAASALGVSRNVIAGVVERSKKAGVPIVSRNPPYRPPPGGNRLPRHVPEKRIRVKKELPPPPAFTPISLADAWLPLPGSNPIAIEHHREGCRWPVGEAPVLFCNEPAAQGPYCAAHAALGTRPLPPAIRKDVRW